MKSVLYDKKIAGYCLQFNRINIIIANIYCNGSNYYTGF